MGYDYSGAQENAKKNEIIRFYTHVIPPRIVIVSQVQIMDIFSVVKENLVNCFSSIVISEKLKVITGYIDRLWERIEIQMNSSGVATENINDYIAEIRSLFTANLTFINIISGDKYLMILRE